MGLLLGLLYPVYFQAIIKNQAHLTHRPTISLYFSMTLRKEFESFFPLKSIFFTMQSVLAPKLTLFCQITLPFEAFALMLISSCWSHHQSGHPEAAHFECFVVFARFSPPVIIGTASTSAMCLREFDSIINKTEV